MVSFVSWVSGVDARTHTSPLANLIAVERPPNGMNRARVNGLPMLIERETPSTVSRAYRSHLEKIQTSVVT